MASSHSAAILPQKGGPLKVETRKTPEPGPGEILIQIKAVALNPVDHVQRDTGIMIPFYPAIVGCDTAGIVAKVGPGVENAPAVGSRVLALISSFYQNGSPDHGAFQEYGLAQAEAVIALPDSLSFEQGAVFPLGVMTALTAWTTIGIPLATRYSAADKQGVLIWGAASSVGTYAVQSAKTLGFTVYATASTRNHEMVKTLGADRVFDYKSDGVISQIVGAVKKDGVTLHTAHAVVPESLQPILDVLKETKGSAAARVAHSPMLPEDHPTLENTTIVFNILSMDKAVRDKHISECFHGFLAPGLENGSMVVSPAPQVEAGGLGGINAALDKLRGGVSAAKLVLSI